MSAKTVLANGGNMAVSLYVQAQEGGKQGGKGVSLDMLLKDWQKESDALRTDLTEMMNDLSLEIK